MVSDALLSELERQEKYLAQLPEDYEFPLFNARQAVESQRRSGYKDTAAASREIVDNAIEACATRVDVVFDTVKASNGKRLVSAVAFIDNGAGMSPAMARFALSWGGGTHFEGGARPGPARAGANGNDRRGRRHGTVVLGSAQAPVEPLPGHGAPQPGPAPRQR